MSNVDQMLQELEDKIENESITKSSFRQLNENRYFNYDTN
jgi:hypothetical protein